jgi:hypothetical protein
VTVGAALGPAPALGRDQRAKLGELGAKFVELRFPVDRAPRRCQRRGMVSENLGLTSQESSCNCTGCGMLRAGVCINCAEKTAALILVSGPGEIAVEPCSGACREAIELYFSTSPERWRATSRRLKRWVQLRPSRYRCLLLKMTHAHMAGRCAE